MESSSSSSSKSCKISFPEYKIAVVYITADKEVVKKRVKARATGRTVDDDYLENAFQNIQKSLTIVADVVDFIATVDNSGDSPTPVLRSFKIVDRTHNWAVVKQRFARRIQHPDSFPNALTPIYIKEVAWAKGASKISGKLQLNVSGNIVTLTLSSEAPVTPDLEARQTALIPAKAVRFAYDTSVMLASTYVALKAHSYTSALVRRSSR